MAEENVSIEGLGDVVRLRPMKASDLPTISAWEKEVGWINSVAMRKTLFDLYGEDHLVLEMSNGEQIGFSSPIRLRHDLAFLESIFIRKDYRGKGLGRYLMLNFIEKNKNSNIWLNSDDGKEGFYEKLGFKIGAPLAKLMCSVEDIKKLNSVENTGKTDAEIDLMTMVLKNEMDECLCSELAEFEHFTLGIKRENFFEHWLPFCICIIIRNKRNQIKGYLLARQISSPDVIQPVYYAAPLVVDTIDIARKLIHACCENIPPNSQLFMKVPNVHDGVKEIMKDFNMKVVDKGTSMFDENMSLLDFNKIYSFFPF